ncbi:MAG TPA: glycosyltransferase family 4 protein [Vicinamibacterales bacterium]
MMHVITGEYPPDRGGVADYTAEVSAALSRAGEAVHVWCPGTAAVESVERGVSVHRALGTLSADDLRRAGALLDRYPAPRRLLVQWVPHAFGRRSLNVAFCRWISARAAAGDRVEVMVHEPFLPFTLRPRGIAAAAVHRVMTAILLRAAEHVWVATPAWERMWRPYALGRSVPFSVLPEPASVPVDRGAHSAASARRAQLLDGAHALVGIFSMHSPFATATLGAVLPQVLAAAPDIRVVLIGGGSELLLERLMAAAPALESRVQATGRLESAALSAHLLACDVLLQPYQDGVCARHSSAMTALAHGVPIVTTAGRFTEPDWASSQAVSLARDPHGLIEAVTRLLEQPDERALLRRRALELYAAKFDVTHTVAALLRAVPEPS